MSCGLFSMFDPVSTLPIVGSISVKWILVAPLILMLPWQVTSLPTGGGVISKSLTKAIYNMCNPVQSVVFVSIFTLIVSINLSSLTPLSFAPTAHPGFVLPLSMTMFLPSLIGWVYVKGLRSFFGHLLPTGSPPLLWGFLVLVETVSVSIRPLTLAVRLVANIMAGHIFIEMLVDLLINFPSIFPFGICVFVGLMGFELAVSVVQALVFTNLLVMFTSEQDHQ